MCFEALILLFNGIYVRNWWYTEYRDVKTKKILKMKIREFYGTGLDI